MHRDKQSHLPELASELICINLVSAVLYHTTVDSMWKPWCPSESWTWMTTELKSFLSINWNMRHLLILVMETSCPQTVTNLGVVIGLSLSHESHIVAVFRSIFSSRLKGSAAQSSQLLTWLLHKLLWLIVSRIDYKIVTVVITSLSRHPCLSYSPLTTTFGLFWSDCAPHIRGETVDSKQPSLKI